MGLSKIWAWAGLAAALGLGCACVPWSLDPRRLSLGLNESAAVGDYHWEEPTRATLRVFPTPIMDVYGLKLADRSGKVVFEAPAAAFGLSARKLLLGRYVVLRARLRDPRAEIDLDALGAALPEMLKSPPAQMVLARGGRLRLISHRLGLSEDLGPFDGSVALGGVDKPLHAAFRGVWRGQWADVGAALAAPADFLSGLPSEGSLDVSAVGTTAKLHGNFQLEPKPRFAGSVEVSARSLAAAAAWLGYDASQFSESGAALSGRATLAPDMLSLDEGALGYNGQRVEGAASLTKSAAGWSATATLAAERLDLAELVGPPPEISTPSGAWSTASARITLPPLDLDLRLSAANLVWGEASLADAAFTLQRQGDKAALKILEAEFAGGALSGEIHVENCVPRCQARATLTLANADLAALLQPAGWNALSGRVSGEFDLAALGDTPAALLATAKGEVRIDAIDGVIQGLNFEEALRRSQRRALDIARDLVVGRTAFRDLGGKLTIADGRAEIEEAHLGGPGVSVAGAGSIDLAKCAWAATIVARQADAQGTPSTEGAILELGLKGPWRSPELSLNSHVN